MHSVGASHWKRAPKKGDVTAQLEVANAYFKGNGIEKDLEKATKWYYEAIHREKMLARRISIPSTASSWKRIPRKT